MFTADSVCFDLMNADRCALPELAQRESNGIDEQFVPMF